MLLFPKKIITGGQTGADMGGLIAARELGIESGGTAPKGWLTENGSQEKLLRGFGLKECEEEGFPARTRRNVVDSTGTLLVGRYQSGGSRLTYDVVKELKKPLFLLTFPSPDQRCEEFRNWLVGEEIQVLNVAGNRESQSPGIAEFTRGFLVVAIGKMGS
jgi:Circularly permutated YpsA SLOG family